MSRLHISLLKNTKMFQIVLLNLLSRLILFGPAHSGKICLKYFSSKNIYVLIWVSVSYSALYFECFLFVNYHVQKL